MFSLSKTATCAALGTLVVIGGLGSSARAEPVQRLGPVGPNDTISAMVGTKGVLRLVRARRGTLRPACRYVQPR